MVVFVFTILQFRWETYQQSASSVVPEVNPPTHLEDNFILKQSQAYRKITGRIIFETFESNLSI